MVSDTLEQRIYELVRSHDGIYLFKKKELTPSTDLDSDLQLEDDEVLALMDDFFTTFNVDKGNQPQFLMPVRIMPDFDIFTDGPATVLASRCLDIQI